MLGDIISEQPGDIKSERWAICVGISSPLSATEAFNGIHSALQKFDLSSL